MVKVCSKCYWFQVKEGGMHMGCYAGGKWKKWVPKKQRGIPNDCSDFKCLE